MLDITTSPHFHDAEKAREFLEKMRWPNGPVCPHCSSNDAYKLTPREGSKKSVRLGVYKCAECREQFTVTVGTIFEDSHTPLNKWLLAFHLLCSSKKGMSAHQLHRMLGVTYKTAWFMAHRVRYAMGQPSFTTKLKGVVECDETYVGGKRKWSGKGRPDKWSHKVPVFSVVQRDGEVRSFHVERVTADNLTSILKQNVKDETTVLTDGFASYDGLGARFGRHEVINHSADEYARTASDGLRVHTNTVEGYFGTLKRGITGIYHHVGSQHLHRYLSEFDFRYNNRKIKDESRTLKALQGAEGKRLQLKDSKTASSPSVKAN